MTEDFVHKQYQIKKTRNSFFTLKLLNIISHAKEDENECG